jgi:hypothetical protein
MATSKLCCNTYVPSYKAYSILIHLSFTQLSVANLTGNREWILNDSIFRLFIFCRQHDKVLAQAMVNEWQTAKKLFIHADADYIKKPWAQTI